MQLTERQRRRIAGRARTLQERLDVPAHAGTGESDADWTVDDPEEWIDEWRDRVARGDEEAFRRRLDRTGLSLPACRDRIRTNHWPDERPLPEWVGRIDDLLGYVGATDEVEPPFEEPRPFQTVFWAIVEYADEQLDPAARSSAVAPSATTDLRRWLYERVHVLLSHPLFIEFKTFVARRDRELVFGDPGPLDDPRKHYDDFVGAVFDGGLREFFLEYSFGARLLDHLVRNWVDAVEEFCRRLDDDLAAIGNRFAAGSDPGRVVDVETHGDPHCGGRVVFRVDFEDGTTVAYKPRAVGVETAFFDLLSWLDRQSDRLDLQSLDCLDRDGYGWIEWIEPRECSSPEEAGDYYRRAGALVCVLYALNFTDGHLENVVAAGDHPFVVDLETVAQPDLDLDRVPGAPTERPVLRDSVLRTMFVPVERSDPTARDASGFGSTEATATGVEVPEFVDVNTDVMDLQYRESMTIAGENLPTYDGQVIPPEDHLDELCDGFRDAYDALLANRSALLADSGPIDAFDGVEIRFLYRATPTYGSILTSTTTPEYLRTGLPFGCKVEGLARPFVTGSADPDCWPVYEAERDSLSRFDVPRFGLDSDEVDLHLGDRSVRGLTDVEPVEAIRRRVDSLSVDDRDEQLDYVELGYGDQSTTSGRSHSPVGTVASGTGSVRRPDSGPVEDGDVEALGRRVAETVADRILDHAARTSGGDPVWFLREPTLDSGVRLSAVDDSLYQGRIGIALLFAAVSDGDDEYGSFATEVAAPLYDRARGDDSFADQPIGACEGVGSLVYGLTKLGELLDDDRYLEAAGLVGDAMTPDRIADDERHDVFGGSAGAILGSLGRYRATGSDDSLASAVAAGEHLLSAADEGPVWRGTEYGRWLTGFSHGSAGIAYALARLADASGETRFRDAALDAVRRERRAYDPDAQNWPDRRPEAEGFADAWCHGRTGVGLARVGTYGHLQDEVVREDVERALAGVDPTTLPPEDHLCCGTAGRVAFLQQAGRTLDDETALDDARRLAARCVERGSEQGFPVRLATEHWYNPALFTGEAGIGYELLRLSEPDLPCVLLWE